jgi:hypothetical protein
MKKSEILSQLRAAKSAHINWVQKAKMLIGGFKIDEKSIPINSTECQFGKWFYSDAQKLNALQNNPLECMSNIEQLHFKLHDIYMHIFKIYYQMEKQSFFSKLFGKEKKVSELDQANALEYYEEMENISNLLIEEINRMERRIIAVQESEMEKID